MYVTVTILQAESNRSVGDIFHGRDLADKYSLTSFLVPSEVNKDKKPSECH